MPAEFAHLASKKLLKTAGHNPMNLEKWEHHVPQLSSNRAMKK